MMQAVENRMVIGEYFDDELESEETDEMPFEAFDRLLMAALMAASGG